MEVARKHCWLLLTTPAENKLTMPAVFGTEHVGELPPLGFVVTGDGLEFAVAYERCGYSVYLTTGWSGLRDYLGLSYFDLLLFEYITPERLYVFIGKGPGTGHPANCNIGFKSFASDAGPSRTAGVPPPGIKVEANWLSFPPINWTAEDDAALDRFIGETSAAGGVSSKVTHCSVNITEDHISGLTHLALPPAFAISCLGQGITTITWDALGVGSWEINCELNGSSAFARDGYHKFVTESNVGAGDVLVIVEDDLYVNVWNITIIKGSA